MGTKQKPGHFDCYNKAYDNEPLFVLLGRDPDAPLLVEMWAALRERKGNAPAKVREARECARAMREYRELGVHARNLLTGKTNHTKALWSTATLAEAVEHIVAKFKEGDDEMPAAVWRWDYDSRTWVACTSCINGAVPDRTPNTDERGVCIATPEKLVYV